MKVTKMISRKMAGGILLGFLAVAGIVTGSQGSVTVYAAEEVESSGLLHRWHLEQGIRLNDELTKIFKDKVIGFPTLMEVIE